MDVKTIAVAILGGSFDHNELGDNDIACVPGALEELQQKHVTSSDDVQLDLIERSHFDRVTAERDALQLRLNAVEEENDRLRSIESAAKEMLRIAAIANQGSNAYNRAIINLHETLEKRP